LDKCQFKHTKLAEKISKTPADKLLWPGLTVLEVHFLKNLRHFQDKNGTKPNQKMRKQLLFFAALFDEQPLT